MRRRIQVPKRFEPVGKLVDVNNRGALGHLVSSLKRRNCLSKRRTGLDFGVRVGAEYFDSHNGPLLMGRDFHNTGVPAAPGLPRDDGRKSGVQKLLGDEFNCLGRWSDARGYGDCGELRFVASSGEQLDGAFKPPTLRNRAQSAPYMHAGQFASLTDVLNHYNQAKPGPVGHSELHPLGLSPEEMTDLIAFLGSLSSPLAAPPELLGPPAEIHAAP